MFAVAVCLVAAPLADPVRLAGEYDGAGTDVHGRPYQVQVHIRPEGDAYRVWWTGPDGQEFVGVGLRDGRRLAVSWAGKATEGRVYVGLTVYHVRPDGSLEGRWTMFGAKGIVRTETLRPAA